MEEALSVDTMLLRARSGSGPELVEWIIVRISAMAFCEG